MTIGTIVGYLDKKQEKDALTTEAPTQEKWLYMIDIRKGYLLYFSSTNKGEKGKKKLKHDGKIRIKTRETLWYVENNHWFRMNYTAISLHSILLSQQLNTKWDIW